MLDKKELLFLSLVERGKELANARRPTKAEENFRKALLVFPNVAHVYNDLGLVLQEQGRLQEAYKYYLKAVGLDSGSLAIRENLARVTFLLGNFDLSYLYYMQLLKQHWQAVADRSVDPFPLTTVELQAVYRSMSLVKYSMGELDESICYSRLATGNYVDIAETGEHLRLLLSLDKTTEALAVMHLLALTRGLDLPNSILADYALVSIYAGDADLGRSIVEFLLSQRRVAGVLGQISGLLYLKVVPLPVDDSGEVVEVEIGNRDLDEIVCGKEFNPQVDYLPPEWVTSLKLTWEAFCGDDEYSS